MQANTELGALNEALANQLEEQRAINRLPNTRLASAEQALLESRSEVEQLKAEMRMRAQDAAADSTGRVSTPLTLVIVTP